MANIKLKLPESIYVDSELNVEATDFIDIPKLLKSVDCDIYESLFMEREGQIILRPYASVFINNKLFLVARKNCRVVIS